MYYGGYRPTSTYYGNIFIPLMQIHSNTSPKADEVTKIRFL